MNMSRLTVSNEQRNQEEKKLKRPQQQHNKKNNNKKPPQLLLPTLIEASKALQTPSPKPAIMYNPTAIHTLPNQHHLNKPPTSPTPTILENRAFHSITQPPPHRSSHPIPPQQHFFPKQNPPPLKPKPPCFKDSSPYPIWPTQPRQLE